MKKKCIFIRLVMLLILCSLSACTRPAMTEEIALKEGKGTGQIYLYGEVHGIAKILDKELEAWEKHYHEEGMRHLFVELPYYTAEFLNLWMQADNDDILDAVHDDNEGTPSHTPEVKAFYQHIKERCPETIFHGTDVGHQRDTTGKRYLEYLESNGLKDTETYTLAVECIKQGEYYYEHSDDVYRENQMVLNFMREFDKLKNSDIMGIYGAAHTGLEAKDYTNKVPCMANQLKMRYETCIKSEDLSDLAKLTEPYRMDQIKVGEKEYAAAYFGRQELNGFKDYIYREYWRLEEAYEDFKANRKRANVLPYDNYPMLIEEGQIFVIDYVKVNGAVTREYYLTDGDEWKGRPTTVEIVVDKEHL